MPEVSYDGKSFAIDGRRQWLVSGSIDYLRTPRGLWRDRIRAAAQAGLNCIETRVVWCAHERQPGSFDFAGGLDLRSFVQTIAEEGMYCILRPGPYVGGGYDFGGLPAYLHGLADRKGNTVRCREQEPQFMESVDRYVRAVMEQVGDMQVASPGEAGQKKDAPPIVAGGYTGEGGGPIVLMQAEHNWASHHPDQGDQYLVRLVSMLRQQGCVVPICNSNNLWQPVEGAFDTWNGGSDLPAMMRQLAQIAPGTPAMAMEYPTDGPADHWLDTPAEPFDAATHAYRLAGLIGVGAQFNLYPFAAGSDLGFYKGRSFRESPGTVGRAAAIDAPLSEAGQRGEKYAATKRLCTFASHFGNVLAARESDPAPAVGLTETDHPTAVLHQHGTQGTLVMLAKAEKDKTRHTTLMLPSGLQLDVPHAGQRAAWVLLDAPLAGNATLDYTSLSPWAIVGRRLLVVFGPAGAQGVVSIDGQHHDLSVPGGKTPTVIAGDAVHVAILNHEQVDAAAIAPQGLVIGCDGLDENDQPRPLKGWGTQFIIAPDGEISRKRINSPRKPAAPRLGDWLTLSLKSFIEGSDERYQPIDGPAPLGALGQAFGYGWYRLTHCKSDSGKLMAIDGGDRLHVYQSGKLSGVLGIGEGASDEPTALKLKGDAIILADNLGRISDGQDIGQDPKGLPSPLYSVKPIKPGKPEHLKQPAGNPFAVTGLAYHQRAGVRPMSEALAWTVKPESRKPVVLEIDGLDQPCVVSVNDEPVRFYAAQYSGHRLRLLLDPMDEGPMTGGKNTIKLELLTPLAEGVAIDKHVRFYQATGTATPKNGGSFAPWTVPAADDTNWRALPKSLPSQPAWLCGTFSVQSTDAPLFFQPAGLSKGQAYLNGHNLGRYWQQTREGKLVNPDQRLYLPEAWLAVDAPNMLMLFDEHGRSPEKSRLFYA